MQGLVLLSLTVLVLLPVTALAVLPFWLVLQRVTEVSFLTLFAGYLMVGAALFFRSTQQLLLATFFAARPATPRELEILEPAWHNVLDTAGIDRKRYVLAVSDVPYVDAIAAGGHVVAVSRLALTVLPADELEAALAHELGYHLGLHSTSRLAALWLETPVLLFARLGVGLELAAYGLALLFAWQEDFGPAFGAALAGLAVRVASHLVPAAMGLTGVLYQLRNQFGRFSVYQADRTAVDLGYGDALVELLERTVELRVEGDDSRGEHLLGRQSMVAKRIERIETRLAEQDTVAAEPAKPGGSVGPAGSGESTGSAGQETQEGRP